VPNSTLMDPTKAVERSRQQDCGHGSWNQPRSA